jgi:hypothetical protein
VDGRIACLLWLCQILGWPVAGGQGDKPLGESARPLLVQTQTDGKVIGLMRLFIGLAAQTFHW